MIIDLKAILHNLDKHASEFNFPVLDNAYVQMAAVRLTAFISLCHWVIAFEVLGYSINEGAFVDDLYAYGSCLEQEGIISSSQVMYEVPDDPLIDPQTQVRVADWADWSIRVGDETFHLSPTYAEYKADGISVAGVSGPGSLTEVQLMRFFVAKYGSSRLFHSESALKNELKGCQDLRLFVRTEAWQHPDVAGGELPSETPAIRTLISALSAEDPTKFDPGKSNTQWSRWDVLPT